MTRTGFRLLAAGSLLVAALASGANRPHYGGTLHVCLRAAPISLSPRQAAFDGSATVTGMLFDTLVTLDDQGRPAPGLAATWRADSGNRRWEFSLRPGVTFSDGTPLTGEIAAASLRAANPAWKVLASGDTVIVERDSPSADLATELALRRNSIVKGSETQWLGTGPFVVKQWEAGKKLVANAREDYWNGRPFLDAVEIEFGRSYRDQMVALELGKAQVVEVSPEQARQATAGGQHVELSAPIELVALMFNQAPKSPSEAKEREVLSLSIDRRLLNSVVLQSGGEPSGSLLPNWMTGYEFLLPADSDMARAQQERAEIPETTVWNLGYDPDDPIARLLAERVLLNARDAGLRIQLASGAAGVRLVRIRLASLDPAVALGELAIPLGLPGVETGDGSAAGLYQDESKLLKSLRVIPLLHLRVASSVSKSVRDWSAVRDGSWRLSNVWLAAERP